MNNQNTQTTATGRHRPSAFRSASDFLSLDDAIQEFEQYYILRLLSLNHGHRRRTSTQNVRNSWD